VDGLQELSADISSVEEGSRLSRVQLGQRISDLEIELSALKQGGQADGTWGSVEECVADVKPMFDDDLQGELSESAWRDRVYLYKELVSYWSNWTEFGRKDRLRFEQACWLSLRQHPENVHRVLAYMALLNKSDERHSHNR
jgi:hypothetical protein